MSASNKRIWSLLEMLNFKAHNFVYVCQLLAQIGQVHEFANLSAQPLPLSKPYGLGQALAGFPNTPQKDSSDISRTTKVMLSLEVLQHQCQALGLKFTCKKIQEILSKIKKEQTWYDQAVLRELSSRIYDELSEGMYFQITDEDSIYYDRMAKWEKVIVKHSNLSTDIDEAGKCLSMGRYTAAVFHLMRIVESGVQSMGKKLNVPESQDKQWGTIVGGIESEIEKRWPSKNIKLTATQKKKRQAYHEALVYLKSVRLAWRNEVMHPKDTYTQEEAVNIYNAVLAFMNNILTMMKV